MSEAPSAADRYLAHGMAEVRGWLETESARVVRALQRLQDANGVRGNVAEIGVHHGKLFLLHPAACSAPEDPAAAAPGRGDGGIGVVAPHRRPSPPRRPAPQGTLTYHSVRSSLIRSSVLMRATSAGRAPRSTSARPSRSRLGSPGIGVPQQPRLARSQDLQGLGELRSALGVLAPGRGDDGRADAVGGAGSEQPAGRQRLVVGVSEHREQAVGRDCVHPSRSSAGRPSQPVRDRCARRAMSGWFRDGRRATSSTTGGRVSAGQGPRGLVERSTQGAVGRTFDPDRCGTNVRPKGAGWFRGALAPVSKPGDGRADGRA